MLSAKKELFTPSGGNYQISRSVRLRSSASASFNRTFTTGNTKTWTWSGWVKRGSLSGTQQFIFNHTASQSYIQFNTSENITVGFYSTNSATGYILTTSQVFRDPSAWYHVVWAVDTTQATNTNRIKLYVNGVQVTAFSSATYPAQNDVGQINTAAVHRIASYDGSILSFDGYLTEINFIDGQALTPSSFGETNALTGVWQPKRYAGTYGTNGFYLPFTLNANSTYAGSFNGSSQGLTTTATGINPSTGSWTIEGWAYSTNAAANEAIITGQVSGSDYLYWNYVGTTLYIGDGVTNILTISNAKPTNQWYHWALVKNGSTYTAYINGQSIGSSTTALRSGTLTTWQIGIRTSVSYYWNGSISNVRVNSTTAIYTTKFTPPISPLTAISGTQLLTLQDATIIDNSTNAYSITNTGSVATTTSTVVFAAPTIGSDASGNVNNWTANNINVSTAGTTYDSMIDVPTLYDDGGNGRGNYATLNPLQSAVAPSDGNLKITGATAHRNSLGTINLPSTSKFYFEGFAPAIQRFAFGLAQRTMNLTVDAGSSSVFSGIYGDSSLTRCWNNGTSLFTLSAIAANDVFQIAVDCATGKVWLGRNNTFYSSAGATTGDPVAGTNATFTLANITDYTSVLGVYDNASNSHINFGQRPFTYTPPTGFKALNTQNLPTPTISNGAAYMAATLYTGNGTTQSISNAVNGVSMQPDFVWVKSRQYTTVGHSLFDALRPIGVNSSLPRLVSNSTDAETNNGGLTAFVSNGFSLNNDAYINSTSTGGNMVAWQWNAGGSTVTNTSGTISSQVRANATAGFSVVTYTGTGSAATVGHGLGVAPQMIIAKTRNGVNDWFVYTQARGATKTLYLNLTNAEGTTSAVWNNTAPTSTVFTVGTTFSTNTCVAYCFAAVAGYSAFGSYTGNGSADGVFVYLGFRARFLMIKRTDSTGGWVMLDTARDTYNDVDNYLYANSSAADAGSSNVLDINSNGFKIRNSWTDINASGGTYVYMAFAENPFKNSLAR